MGDTSGTTARGRRRSRGFAVVVTGLALALLAAACGGGDDDDDASDTTRGRSTTSRSGDTKDDGDDAKGAVSSLDDVQSATIQVIGQGTFRDPEIGQADGSGAGSGFIISKDGLAVTNNHVVAGAGTLEVFIGGDSDHGYNASIVGVSECNDLALIKIKADDDLPFLRWYDGDIKPGLEVHAAGFPLGDPEYTLTNGSITKAKAGGDLTGTSSIDHTIEHDADTQPGNSGGPLVTDDGEVVAVHYAASQDTGTPQRYGIAADLAEPVIDHLEDGDFESLGINGWAVDDEASGITGIWVAGVAAGSPAAEAKLLAGDIVTSMNGVPVGADGTFKDYCDVIRTAGSKAIAVEVLRYDTEQVLRGEINGDQPLEQAFSFKQQVEDDSAVGAMPTTPEYSDYTQVTDDSGQIIVEVPSTWNEVDTTSYALDDGSSVPYIAASPDLDGYSNTYTVPGMDFALFGPSGDLDALLAEFSFSGECTDQGIDDYADPIFTGRYQLWSDCAGTHSVVVVLTAQPAQAAYTAVIVVQATSEADLDALDHIFSTFDVLV
jgi:serine protease Do